MKSISDNENINSVNPLHLIIGELDGTLNAIPVKKVMEIYT